MLSILRNVYEQKIAMVGRSYRVSLAHIGACEPADKLQPNLWPNEIVRWACQFQRMYIFWMYNTIWKNERYCHYKFNIVQRMGKEGGKWEYC